MANNWVVVANNSGATIFTPAPHAPRLKDPETIQYSMDESPPSRPVELEALEHPEERLRSQSMDAERIMRKAQQLRGMQVLHVNSIFTAPSRALIVS